MDQCSDLVVNLMNLNRNKQKYYQQGLRAIKAYHVCMCTCPVGIVAEFVSQIFGVVA